MSEVQMTPELMKQLMGGLTDIAKPQAASEMPSIMPQFIMPQKRREKLGIEEVHATVKELTTLDYIVVKNIMAKEKNEDKETLELVLIAMSFESIDWIGQDGKPVVHKLKPVESIGDLYQRMAISPKYWEKISKVSIELNSVNPEQLGK